MLSETRIQAAKSALGSLVTEIISSGWGVVPEMRHPSLLVPPRLRGLQQAEGVHHSRRQN